jgi:putative ABC transport system substrate-binding protein
VRRQSRRRLLRGALALGSLALLGGCATLPVGTPTAEPARRIGVLLAGRRDDGPAIRAFVDGLRERGWIIGRNLVIEWREGQGQPSRYRSLANDLVKLRAEVVVAQSTGLLEAARAAGPSTPIVTLGLPVDPVGLGWATSLARPGRTITGTVISREVEAKRVELLKDLVPGLTRVGILLAGPPDAVTVSGVATIESAARTLGLTPISLEVSSPSFDLGPAFAEAARQRVEALVVFQSAPFSFRRTEITERVRQLGVPAIYPARSYVADGGLMSYGPAFNELYGRTARYVDEILRGAYPGDLPIEQATSYELVLSLRVAQALNLTIPQPVLQQVTDITE